MQKDRSCDKCPRRDNMHVTSLLIAKKEVDDNHRGAIRDVIRTVCSHGSVCRTLELVHLLLNSLIMTRADPSHLCAEVSGY